MIKFKELSHGKFRFWIARCDAELPTKYNSWTLAGTEALQLIKAIKE